MSNSLSEHIARYTIETQFDSSQPDLNSEHLAVLALSLMDWCTVGRAGVDEPVSRLVRAVNLADGGYEQASIFGSSQRLPARLAAQVNGATSHALDYDDTHFLHVGHTSVVVFSAAFAVGEWRSVTLGQLMEAALIGSEVCCHIGHWLGRSHYQAGFHQTATAGIFGAAATACRLLDADVNTTQHALGLATTMASGLTSQFGTMGKPFHAGMAAANGVEAAILAANGFISSPDALQSAQGFADTHHVDFGESDSREFLLGHHAVFSDVQHKYHACCHGLHASLEAVSRLRSAERIDPANINRIVISTNPRWLNVCNVASPLTGLEAKFSYRQVIALLLTDHDTAALDTYSDTLCADSTVKHFRDKVDVIGLNELTDTQTKVLIEMNDGAIHKTDHDLTDPLPLSVRQEKLLSKCSSLLGTDTSDALWQLIRSSHDRTAADFAKTAMHGELRQSLATA